MRRVLLLLLGIVVGFAIASGAVVLFDTLSPKRPQRVVHPHIAFLQHATGISADIIDFSSLNDGYWRWLCLFGAGAEPVAFVKGEAGRRGEPVEIGSELAQSFPPGALPAGSGALSVVDDLGSVSLVRFTGMASVDGLKGPVCTDRKNPVVTLAGR